MERPVTAGMLWRQVPDTPVSAAENEQLAENKEPVGGTTWLPVAVVANVSKGGVSMYCPNHASCSVVVHRSMGPVPETLVAFLGNKITFWKPVSGPPPVGKLANVSGGIK